MHNGTYRIRDYQISHQTSYRYGSPVSMCHNQLHLRTRDVPGQRLLQCNIEITPTPEFHTPWTDGFGNPCDFFSIERLHHEMSVHATSLIQRHEPYHQWYAGFSVEQLRSELLPQGGGLPSNSTIAGQENSRAIEFLNASKYCSLSDEFTEFMKPVWNPQQDCLEWLDHFNRFLYESIQYSPRSTDVSTSSIDALRSRQGVCQDLANIFISCMRTIGIPARYVSGYLITVPAPGQPKLVGADASHAWVSVYTGPWGWIDWDPTNNMRVDLDHISIAWGRDYADVAPVQGVFIGGGETTLNVAVDVVLANEQEANRSKPNE